MKINIVFAKFCAILVVIQWAIFYFCDWGKWDEMFSSSYLAWGVLTFLNLRIEDQERIAALTVMRNYWKGKYEEYFNKHLETLK
jgi:hypothetical protein